MKRVVGIGGIFFKSKDPEKLYQWYEKHLDVKRGDGGCVIFPWPEPGNTDKSAYQVWSPFPRDTQYFEPSQATFMINFRVENLEALVPQLKSEGVRVLDRREESEFGKFAWVLDPDENCIELWEPPVSTP